MNLDRYELTAGHRLASFDFVSEGPKGRIIKRIWFQKIYLPNLYNLAFGDLNLATGQFDDKVITDNGDSIKILATVVDAIYTFTEYYPDAWIYAIGSTSARTRLYQMGINKYLDITKEDFYLLGEHQNEWKWYERGKDYNAFVVHRKTH